MKDSVIKHEYPPNFSEIESQFTYEGQSLKGKDVVFTYYPHIYVPSGRELPPDLQVHENIHLHQQEEMTVKVWWMRYLKDPDFRLEQELEAYGAQARFWKPWGNKMFRFKVMDFARDLSSDAYGNIISFAEAESKIRNVAKNID